MVRLAKRTVRRPSHHQGWPIVFVSEFVDQTDCLILDVAIPGMSGPALQQELARRGSTIPIVFITAQGEASLSLRLLQAGAIECLLKPFSEAALLDAVTRALRR